MFQSMTEDRAVMFRSVSEWAGIARELFKLITVWRVVLKMTVRCHCKRAV